MLVNLPVSRFNLTMNEAFDPELIKEINQVDYEAERRERGQALIARAIEIQIELNTLEFDDEDARWSYTHKAMEELNDASIYFGRRGKVNGRCGWQDFGLDGRAQIAHMHFDDTPVIDRGFIVLQRDDLIDSEDTKYFVGHWLELEPESSSVERVIVAPLTGPTDITYELTLDEHGQALRALLPADQMDFFDRITDVGSDEELSDAVALLSRMRIDLRQMNQDTIIDLADYMTMRLGIRKDIPYLVAMNERLVLDGDTTYKIDTNRTDATIATLGDLALLSGIGGGLGEWFFELHYVAPTGVDAHEGLHVVPLSSIEVIQPLDYHEEDDGE